MLRFPVHVWLNASKNIRTIERNLTVYSYCMPQHDVRIGKNSANRFGKQRHETTKVRGQHMAFSSSNTMCLRFQKDHQLDLSEKEKKQPTESDSDVSSDDENLSDYSSDYNSGSDSDDEVNYSDSIAIERIRNLSKREKEICLQMSDLQNELADVQTKQPYIWLRYLYLRFRVTAREMLEPYLLTKEANVLESNRSSISKQFYFDDYSVFLKQLQIKSVGLESLLRKKGIDDSADFFEVCEFAFTNDKEAYKKMYPSQTYYSTHDSGSFYQIKFSAPFDNESSENFIEKLDSISTQLKCRKMIVYIQKLSS